MLPRATELNLNGSLARLGTLGEVSNSGQSNFMFSVEDNTVEIIWSLQSQDRTKEDFIPKVESIQIQSLEIKSVAGSKKYSDIESLNMLLPSGVDAEAIQLVERLREVIFLSAVRIGTAEVFPSP